MAAHPKPRLTPEEYLKFERAAEFRHEYFNGEIFAMAGASYRHSQIIFSLARELGRLLDDGPCDVLGQDLRVNVSPNGLYTYPDLLVVCGGPIFIDDAFDTVRNPSLVIEVLSPSTEAYDRGFKSAQYRKIESLREYALVSQAEARVEVYRRQDSGQWLLSEFTGMDTVCIFESVGCRVPLAKIYRHVSLDDSAASQFPTPPTGA